VKAMDGTLYTSSNSGQLSSMIGAMGRSYAVRRHGGDFFIGTTSDTVLSPTISVHASTFNITVTHWKAYYRMISGAMHVRFNSVMGNTSSVILK
jgi:hypothetical protein